MTTRDPHVAIDRDIVVYPASGDDPKPRICKMTFNEAGANHPRGLYTTAIDLRSTYGSQMRLTRFQVLDVENQPDKHAEGEYMFYYNLSPSLPVNAAMALIVGVNPKRPGWRPIWRGDVVVVKTQEWPDPIKMGAQVIVEEDKRLFGMLRANGKSKALGSVESPPVNPSRHFRGRTNGSFK